MTDRDPAPREDSSTDSGFFSAASIERDRELALADETPKRRFFGRRKRGDEPSVDEVVLEEGAVESAAADAEDVESEDVELAAAVPQYVGPMISGRGVRKEFGTTVALDDFEIEVNDGEVHAFLGPNGAGKTTLLRILLGLVQRDEGVLTVMGLDPWQDAVRLHRHLAYVPGDVELWPSLTGGETIDLLVRMRKVEPTRRDELIERFELDPTKKVRTYSKGNRQKVVLIAALAADVPLYLLDEPTDGLDPLMAQVFREAIAERRDAGATVLLSSHILSEVEAVADRITIIRSGRCIESGTIAELRHLTRTRVTAVTARPVTGLSATDEISELTIEGSRLVCDVSSPGLAAVLAAVQQAGPVSLDCRPPSLEEIFLRHYGAEQRPAEAMLPDSDDGGDSADEEPAPADPVIDLTDGATDALRDEVRA